jgi:hypothetical protein
VFTQCEMAGKRCGRARSGWRGPVQIVATVLRMQYARAKGRTVAMLKSGRVARQAVVAGTHRSPEDRGQFDNSVLG